MLKKPYIHYIAVKGNEQRKQEIKHGKFATLRKLATRTPVSTKRTNQVASKNHTSSRDRNFFLRISYAGV